MLSGFQSFLFSTIYLMVFSIAFGVIYLAEKDKDYLLVSHKLLLCSCITTLDVALIYFDVNYYLRVFVEIISYVFVLGILINAFRTIGFKKK
jgi:uncharacterized membrane protein YoaK (UPF0700 family)